MTADELVAQGNQYRDQNQPEEALSCYARAFATDRNNAHAFNNYGHVLRELGDPAGAVPFLQRAAQLDPTHATAAFNLSLAYLLAGDYERGWPQYEHRWTFEHLAGTLPQYEQPRWTGQDLEGKTVFVIGEQGFGDNLQFVRFIKDLTAKKATVIMSVHASLITLFDGSSSQFQVIADGQVPEHFDYWTPIMSLPGVLKYALENLPQNLFYITADAKKAESWKKTLGLKHRLRVGFCYSGRQDAWLNRHKGMTVDDMLTLIERNPDYDWICLQMDADESDLEKLLKAGVKLYHDQIQDFSDTAALVHHLDVVVSVDTAVAHLAGAMGRSTWIPLNCYATDWRWLLGRDSIPWYPSVRLFRQTEMLNWAPVLDRIHQHLKLFKI
jgi:tetratricopeptide (TPR) repeat protein